MTAVKILPGRVVKYETGGAHYQWNPLADIIESKDDFTIEFDLPGFKKNEIDVSVDENILLVSGERKHAVPEDDTYFRRFERPEGTFSRSFRIPKNVDGENIKCTYKSGVLSLALPKKEEAKTPYD